MAPLADPEDESAQQLYRQCMHHLMALPSENRQQDSPKSSKTSSHVDVRVWESRTDVFRGLLELVPREHKEIPKDLVDLASNFMTQS